MFLGGRSREGGYTANLFDAIVCSRLAFNFVGVAAGWLMRKGYANVGSALLEFIK